jgi:hypothetical protein
VVRWLALIIASLSVNGVQYYVVVVANCCISEVHSFCVRYVTCSMYAILHGAGKWADVASLPYLRHTHGLPGSNLFVVPCQHVLLKVLHLVYSYSSEGLHQSAWDVCWDSQFCHCVVSSARLVTRRTMDVCAFQGYFIQSALVQDLQSALLGCTELSDTHANTM